MSSRRTIAHLSDIHCGDPHFMPELMERAIADINALRPDIIVCSGDLTTYGFKEEYAQAKRYLDQLDCESFVVIPGNHDSRNVGYVHFEDLFGKRNSVLRKAGITVVAVDSTEPDLDHGQIGRGRYGWIEAAVRAARRPARLRPASPPAAGARHRAGAEHRLRRRRRDRVPAAGRCQPRALRAQARSVCLAARKSLRRQHRNCLHFAPARQHAALLQRRRDRRQPRRGLAALSVSRPGAHHPVRPRDARVREVHRADRAAR